MGVHAVLLLTLALMGYTASREANRELTASTVVDSRLPDFNRIEVQDIDRPEAPTVTPG